MVRGAWRGSVAETFAETRAQAFRDHAYQPVPGRTFVTLAALDAFFASEPEVADDGEVCMDAAEGTASILDIRALGDEVEPGLSAPLSDAQLVEVFGTRTPTPAAVTWEACSPLFEALDRGESRYVVAYEHDAPAEAVFIGYSWD
ncbi:MAG: hypothetical protein JWM10_5202 [Myxococcaceae bacterium]|nr:hypothetical protein [Myxococcaceae bacterium]